MASATMTAALRQVARLLDEGTLAGMGDDLLLGRYLDEGDDDAFDVMIARHGSMVLRTCLDVLHDPADAEDTFQATFLTLIRRGRSIRGGECVGGWLRRVARRVARAANADRRRRLRRDAIGAARLNAIDPIGADPLIATERQNLIQAEIDRLPESYQHPVRLCLVEGHPQREAARRLGVSEGVIRGQITRARVLLRDRLTRRGITPTIPVVPAAWVRATLMAARLGAQPRWAITGPIGLIARATTVVLVLVGALAGAGQLWQSARTNPPPRSPSAPLAPPRVDPPPRQVLAVTQPSTPVDDRTIVFRGQVLDPEGRAVPGARLFLTTDPWASAIEQGSSGADGSYRLDLPARTFRKNFGPTTSSPPVRITLIATAPGFGAAWELPEADPATGCKAMKPEYRYDFHLVDDQPIDGRVVDDAGQPIAGARAEVFRVEAFKANRPGIPVLDALHTIPATDSRASVLDAIRLLDPNPLYDRFEGSINHGAWELFPAATTGVDGRFHLPGVGRDRLIHLRITGPGLRAAEIQILTVANIAGLTRTIRDRFPRQRQPDGSFYTSYNTPREVEHAVLLYDAAPTFVAERGQTVSGTVRDARTGAPIPDARLCLGISANSNAQGWYRGVRDDHNASIQIFAQSPDEHRWLNAAREFTNVDKPGEIVADFALEAGITLTGRVVEAETGRPIVAHERWICSTPPFPVVAGMVEYFPLSSNTTLRATPTGQAFINREGRPNREHTAWIEQDGSFRLLVPPGPGVLLVRAQPGLPMFMGVQRPWLATDELYSLFPYAPLVQRRPDDGAPGGDRASFDGFADSIPVALYHAYAIINPVADTPTMTVDFAIPRPAVHVVRFVGPDGLPVAGVTVTGLLPAPLPMVEVAGAEVEAIGIDPARPRSILALSHDGRFAARAVVRATHPPTPQTIQLDPIGGIKGRLVDDATGRPLAGYTVAFRYGDGSVPLPHPQNQPTTAADGQFSVPGLFADQTCSVWFEAPADPAQTFGIPEYRASAQLQNLTLRPGEVRVLGDVRVEGTKSVVGQRR